MLKIFRQLVKGRKIMKKIFKNLSLLLSTVLVVASLAACGKTPAASASVETSVETSVEASTEASVEASTEASAEASVEASTEEPAALESPESLVFEEGELGEGETQFTFVVADIDGNAKTFTINTNETTVGAALVNIGIIAGDESEYGLYVKSVNGVTADWNVDQTYWAFYINDEYAMTGVDATEIVAGSTYKFQISK